jgi:hypothetical protein
MPITDESALLKIISFVQGDLRKLNNIYELYKFDNDFFNSETIENTLVMKSSNDNTRKITENLINNKYNIEDHSIIMNETDRTIVGLLWHENIIDVFEKINKKVSIPIYLNILDNICFSDYIDRVTFQKQIWQFNEMSSLIKTFKNNKIFNEFKNNDPQLFTNITKVSDIRFTKVLTKYSTEFSNFIFIQKLCQELEMGKYEAFAFMLDLKPKYYDNEIYLMFENLNINKLDINRIYRYLDKYIKETTLETENEVPDEIIEEQLEEICNCMNAV